MGRQKAAQGDGEGTHGVWLDCAWQTHPGMNTSNASKHKWHSALFSLFNKTASVQAVLVIWLFSTSVSTGINRLLKTLLGFRNTRALRDPVDYSHVLWWIPVFIHYVLNWLFGAVWSQPSPTCLYIIYTAGFLITHRYFITHTRQLPYAASISVLPGVYIHIRVAQWVSVAWLLRSASAHETESLRKKQQWPGITGEAVLLLWGGQDKVQLSPTLWSSGTQAQGPRHRAPAWQLQVSDRDSSRDVPLRRLWSEGVISSSVQGTGQTLLWGPLARAKEEVLYWTHTHTHTN